MQNQATVLRSFSDYLEKERMFSPNTLSAYGTDVRQFLDFLDEYDQTLTFHNIRSDHVYLFRQRLANMQSSVATRARKMASISTFFQFAQKMGWVQFNPAVDLVFSVKPRPIEVLEEGSLSKVLASITGSAPQVSRDKAMISLLGDTGMRPTELVSLGLSSINMSEGTADWTGRNGKKRQVAFSESTAQLLRHYVASARPRLLRNIREPALFLNHRGHRITRQGLWLALSNSARSAGIQRVTSQRIRHTSAVQKLKSGVTLAEVRQQLGHAFYSTTLGLYRTSTRPAASA